MFHSFAICSLWTPSSGSPLLSPGPTGSGWGRPSSPSLRSPARASLPTRPAARTAGTAGAFPEPARPGRMWVDDLERLFTAPVDGEGSVPLTDGRRARAGFATAAGWSHTGHGGGGGGGERAGWTGARAPGAMEMSLD